MTTATLRQIDESALMLRLGGLAADLMRDVYPSHRTPPTRSLTAAEEYARRSFFAAGEVFAICEQLEISILHLSGHRTRILSTDRVFTRYDYLLFHLENHLLRSVMLADRILQMTNVVFRLGLPESECRVATVMKNDRVAKSKLPAIYNSIDKTLRPARTTRNIVVHRRGLRDDALERVSSFYVLQKIGDERHQHYALMFKQMTDDFVRDKKSELNLLNASLYGGVVRFFNALGPWFEQNLAELS